MAGGALRKTCGTGKQRTGGVEKPFAGPNNTIGLSIPLIDRLSTKNHAVFVGLGSGELELSIQKAKKSGDYGLLSQLAMVIGKQKIRNDDFIGAIGAFIVSIGYMERHTCLDGGNGTEFGLEIKKNILDTMYDEVQRLLEMKKLDRAAIVLDLTNRIFIEPWSENPKEMSKLKAQLMALVNSTIQAAHVAFDEELIEIKFGAGIFETVEEGRTQNSELEEQVLSAIRRVHYQLSYSPRGDKFEIFLGIAYGLVEKLADIEKTAEPVAVADMAFGMSFGESRMMDKAEAAVSGVNEIGNSITIRLGCWIANLNELKTSTWTDLESGKLETNHNTARFMNELKEMHTRTSTEFRRLGNWQE
ncbi:hypothetical protein KJ780_01900 [Candidatus Micrarchaeota archaeon]|nr:hypothetical protein [Candidatus Micrarchaeota archaeon]